MKTIINEGSRNPVSQHKGTGDWSLSDFRGESAQACEVRKQLQFLAGEPDAVCILITGETGVGKDLAAKILHSLSVNAKDKKNFIHVNCGELHKDHVRSELFGHRKASFTGALEHRDGCFVAAENGTVFLNEIGNIEHDIQAMLLHVLDDHKVKPLGYDREVEVNPMIIFATNANLELMVEQGLFRLDLLMRMQCYTLHIPPLRSRPEDIPPVVDFLYANICKTPQTGIKPVIEKEVYGMLQCLPLKGNVRELENKLRAAYKQMKSNNEIVLRTAHFDVAHQPSDTAYKDTDLKEQILTDEFKQKFRIYIKQKLNSKDKPGRKNACDFDLPAFVAELEEIVLQETGGNKAGAAQKLNISRYQYYKKGCRYF